MTERQLTLHTPALSGDQQLLVRRVQGREALSELFSYEVTLYSKSDAVDFGKVLGQEMCVGLSNPRSLTASAEAAPERFFHGYVSHFASIGTEAGYHLYRAELRPQLWRLTRAVNCRVFQKETIPDIIATVLKEHGITGMVTHYVREYRPWEYCVQYRESDFAFISRLLEREGIHYYFEHQKDKHLLYLGDINPRETVRGYETVKRRAQDGPNQVDEDVVWSWCVAKSVQADRTTLSDYDFTKPAEPLMRTSSSEVKREHDDARDYEVYDFLETVVQQQGYTADLTEEYARIRSEELHTHHALVKAETNATGLAPGFCFKLKGDVPRTAKGVEYLLIAMHVIAENDLRGSSSSGEGTDVYRASFEAIEAKNPFRPARITPKPRIPGPQSAIVVGPSGAKDHHTDQWGRVLVKFHWYRKQHDTDSNMSCWVRVSQNSTGANWGSMFVPHIGQEVIVSFYEGDPDRPVVTGRVYNGSNKPPLDLPANAYKSIIRDHYGNEVVFDGTPGGEHMMLRSPSHGSVLMLGKSRKERTESDRASVSWNKASYALGNSESYTFGSAFSLKKGRSTSVDLGAKFSFAAASEFKGSAGATFDLKAGTSMTFAMSTSVSWGWSTEIRKTKGGYTRMSSKDVVLDSATKAVVSGGACDYSMLVSTDEEIALSFDKTAPDRKSALASADNQIKAMASLFAAQTAVFSGLGAWSYSMTKHGDNKDVNAKHSPDVEAELKQLNGLVGGDIATGAGAASAILGGVLPAKLNIPTPTHKSPSAKVRLTADAVTIFAGAKSESELVMHKSAGVVMGSKGAIAISSDDKGVAITAKSEIALKSNTAVTVDAVLKHRNLQVLK